MKSNTLYNVGDKVVCVLVGNLLGFANCPPLVAGKEYTVQEITLDKADNQHLHVGLKSELAFVSSLETGEELPEGSTKHWCHPSRFVPAAEYKKQTASVLN